MATDRQVSSILGNLPPCMIRMQQRLLQQIHEQRGGRFLEASVCTGCGLGSVMIHKYIDRLCQVSGGPGLLPRNGFACESNLVYQRFILWATNPDMLFEDVCHLKGKQAYDVVSESLQDQIKASNNNVVAQTVTLTAIAATPDAEVSATTG